MDRTVTFSGGFVPDASVSIPSSKSYIHRMAICAALSDGVSTISNVNFSNDITATLGCLETLGCKSVVTDDKIEIHGGKFTDDLKLYNCDESASTLRFMIPVVLAAAGKGKFTGTPTLMKRPLDTYFDMFSDNGIAYDYKAGEYLKAEGGFVKDEYSLDGSVSSQFITGILLALAYLGGRRKLNIIGNLSSAPYVDITREVMQQFGVKVDFGGNAFIIDGSGKFIPQNVIAQGDYSQSAFYLAAAVMGGRITLKNLSLTTSQGDAVIVDLVEKMGGKITKTADGIVAEKSQLKSLGVIDAEDFPDIVPPLALMCTQCIGDTTITNVSRLKIKESNRLLAVQTLLNQLGAEVKIDDNNMYIKGEAHLHGAEVSAFNDHRIAMTAAVAAVAADGSITIKESESVKKSYPKFFDDFVKLGGISVE
ncbi:MAG: 3-phosphoshikimate 1-carboxyvinyltransferase [Clostridia bacterium]|nr:3-phosphoshikimate 1-carboxyvinyltransferase [Clostridia bacterium]